MLEAMSVGLPVLMTRKSRKLLEFDFSGGNAVIVDELSDVKSALSSVIGRQWELSDRVLETFNSNNTPAIFESKIRSLLSHEMDAAAPR